MASVILSVILFLMGWLSPAAHCLRGGPCARTAWAGASTRVAPTNGQSARARVLKAYAALPLSFEPNQGQAAKSDRFVARAPGYTLALRADEAELEVQEPEGIGSSGHRAIEPLKGTEPSKGSMADSRNGSITSNPKSKIQNLKSGHSSRLTRHLSLAKDKGQGTRDSVVRMRLVGANANAHPVSVEKLPGVTNYYLGNDPNRWLTGVPNFRKVGFDGVYPGVNVRYYGTQGRLEYDFVVAPGADPSRIQLAIDRLGGVGSKKVKSQKSKVKIDSEGNLVIAVRSGEVVLRKPVVYQESEVRSQEPESENRSAEKSKVKGQKSKIQQSAVGNTVLAIENGQWDNPKSKTCAERVRPPLANGAERSEEAQGKLRERIQNLKSRNSPPATRHLVKGRFVLLAENSVSFKVGAYDHCKALIIDPLLVYSTYLGGNQGDTGFGIALDTANPDDAYVVGSTASTNFPTVSASQSARSGSASNAFVTKINGAGTALAYSTYLGGTGQNGDEAQGVAVDTSGNAYVVGTTSSPDFPVRPGATATPPAFQATYGGGTSDAFVAKFSPTGTLVYSSFLGGEAADSGFGIAIDSSGHAYVTGSTQSGRFPVVNAFQGFLGGSADAFVAEVNPTGTALTYSTYLGTSNATSGQGIAADATGNAYVTGYTFDPNFPRVSALQATYGGNGDAFVTKFNAGGQTLAFSTYFGGEGQDRGFAITLDTSANIYITGDTQSIHTFPTTSGVFQPTNNGNDDAFVAKISTNGALVYSTFLGGSGQDEGEGIAVDAAGDAFVTGFTRSNPFPTFQPIQLYSAAKGTCNTLPCPYAFVTELNPSATNLLFSTYLGGNGQDFGQGIAVDAGGNAYVTGGTTSQNFPAVAGAIQGSAGDNAGDGDAFVAKIGPGAGPAIAIAPQKLSFGNQAVGTQSTPQTVTVTNVSTSNLTITSVATATSSQFAVQSNGCLESVPPGGTCTFAVVFEPTAPPQTVTEQITITDNASAATTQTITVTGTGMNPTTTISLSPNSLEFGNQTVNSSSTQTVTVTNTGTTALSVTNIAVTGTDFAQSNNCPTTPIQPNTGCTISVTFTPTATGARTGTLTITGNFSGSPQSVPLTGTGISGFSLTSVPQNSQIVTIGSTTATFTIGVVGSSPANATVNLTCGSSATCSFNPASLTVGSSATSTLTVSNLDRVTTATFNFSVIGQTTGSNSQTYTLPLTIAFADFTLSASPSLVNIAAGKSATYTVTVTPTNGFNKPVLLSCPGTLPSGVNCVFSPSAVALNGTSNATATLTITTTARSSQMLPGPLRRIPPGALPAALLALLGLLLVMKAKLEIRNSKFETRRRPLRPAIALFAILLAASLSPGCDQSFPNLISPAPGTGTPAGPYTIIIEGTLSGSTTVNRTTTVNLGVS